VFNLGDGIAPHETAMIWIVSRSCIVTPGFNFTPSNLQHAPLA
jgi:hypothetical protein